MKSEILTEIMIVKTMTPDVEEFDPKPAIEKWLSIQRRPYSKPDEHQIELSTSTSIIGHDKNMLRTTTTTNLKATLNKTSFSMKESLSSIRRNDNLPFVIQFVTFSTF